jgi:hypothetical protein
MDESVSPLLQVLERLPEGIARAVLAASPTDLNHHLSILPASLHHLAINAAFFSIRATRALTFDFDSTAGENFGTACAVLHAATTAVRAVQKFNFQHIPMNIDKRLLQLIAAACMSASDVRLSCSSRVVKQLSEPQPFAQLGDALLHNTSLTRLKLADIDDPAHGFNVDYLLKSLTRLQSLSLAFKINPGDHRCSACRPIPMGITKLHCLTRLCLGHGLQLNSLQQIARHMRHFRVLKLSGFWAPDMPPAISHLIQLQELKLQDFHILKVLPPLPGLTGLQTLHFIRFQLLRELPPLAALTALRNVMLWDCGQLRQVPPLEALTALQTLLLMKCGRLKQLPPLANLSVLKKLVLLECSQLQHLPPLATLTSLQKLTLRNCQQLQELPPLDGLKALQKLKLADCTQIQHLPSLDSLTALQILKLSAFPQLQRLPSLDSLKALQELKVSNCKQLRKLPSLCSLRVLHKLEVGSCELLRQLPSLKNLASLRVLNLWGCKSLTRGCLSLPGTQTPTVRVYRITAKDFYGAMWD